MEGRCWWQTNMRNLLVVYWHHRTNLNEVSALSLLSHFLNNPLVFHQVAALHSSHGVRWSFPLSVNGGSLVVSVAPVSTGNSCRSSVKPERSRLMMVNLKKQYEFLLHAGLILESLITVTRVLWGYLKSFLWHLKWKIDCTRNNKCQHTAPSVYLSWGQKHEDAICGVH